ncbi:hypothetical protein V8E36_008712 [Tilletia maclaganii]
MDAAERTSMAANWTPTADAAATAPAAGASSPTADGSCGCASSHHHSQHQHQHRHAAPLRYSQPTQADEDLLDLLTSGALDSVGAGSISRPQQHQQRSHHHLAASHLASSSDASAAIAAALDPQPSRRPLSTLAALRRPPIDPIVLAATLSSGPHVTRHHFHHSFDGKPPDSSRSQQMPASIRRARLEALPEKEQQLAAHAQSARASSEASGSDSRPVPSAEAAALSPAEGDKLTFSSDQPHKHHQQVYQSSQAPRSVRLALAREGISEPTTSKSTSAAAAAAALSTPDLGGPASTLQQQQNPSMRRFPAPFPQPPLYVRCHARTRIPTPHGEIFAFIYKNNRDLKEHLALVIDPAQNDALASEYYRKRAERGNQKRIRPRRKEIRSRTLDEVWGPDETDMERIVRGAYVGRLGGDYQIASAPTQATGGLVPRVRNSNAYSDDESGDDDEEVDPPLVRIHSECYTGETIGSQRCDCGEQLDEAIRLIAAEDEIAHPPRRKLRQSQQRNQPTAPPFLSGLEHSVDSISFVGAVGGGANTNPHTPLLTGAPPSPTLLDSQVLPSTLSDSVGLSTPPRHPSAHKARRARGIVVYLRQEGRGIGLLEKLMAYNLQDMGHDTVSANILLGHSADARTYDIAAAILRDLGVSDAGVRLLTNNPEKVEGMEREGVRIVERVPMVPRMWRTRREKRSKSSASSKKKKSSAGKAGPRRAGHRAEHGSEPPAASRTLPATRGKSPLLSSPALATGSVFRPSLLGVHSRILSQADGFGDSDGEHGEPDGDPASALENGDDEPLSQSGDVIHLRFQDDEDGGDASQRDEANASLSDAEEEEGGGGGRYGSDDDAAESGSESESDDSYTAHVLRRSGATMIGADVTRSAELEKYLRTKVERMGHMLDLPSVSQQGGKSSAPLRDFPEPRR